MQDSSFSTIRSMSISFILCRCSKLRHICSKLARGTINILLSRCNIFTDLCELFFYQTLRARPEKKIKTKIWSCFQQSFRKRTSQTIAWSLDGNGELKTLIVIRSEGEYGMLEFRYLGSSVDQFKLWRKYFTSFSITSSEVLLLVDEMASHGNMRAWTP